jgi:hypothetical protein
MLGRSAATILRGPSLYIHVCLLIVNFCFSLIYLYLHSLCLFTYFSIEIDIAFI